MWDLDIQGTVVNVVFPCNENDSMYSKKRDHTSGFRIYYELQKISDGFYHIAEHTVSGELVYGFREYLIPVSLAYLLRIGTVSEYESDIEYYYTEIIHESGENDEIQDVEYIENLSFDKVVKQCIESLTGEYVFIDSVTDWDRIVGKTNNKVSYYKKYVQKGIISVPEIKARTKKGGQ